VVLDIMMPGLSGLDVLRNVRPKRQVPILMLTGRGDDIDSIVGLEMGADDYLTKPCNPRELSARIRAIIRRTQQGIPNHHEYIYPSSLKLHVCWLHSFAVICKLLST
jgi:two-component system OmpR family response regulator